MPCAENITRPSVRRDLEFWKHHEEVLAAGGWEFLFPIGYLVVSCILSQQWNTEGRKQTRDSLMALKTGATIAFIGYYTSIPLFLVYENMRIVFFFAHFLSIYSVVIFLLKAQQPSEYQLGVHPSESIGIPRSILLGAVFVFIQVATIVSTGGRYYECPPSFVVVLDDLVFKGMIATHSISYILVKQLWIALRVETILISNDERILAKLMKRGNK
ncbi:hypothetical protein GCK72_013703 [Caenorhabditis remanei]|uniref:Uncharacterized protein n=1 Tax=Caenorhabditis remanei TaxID=31234 RepID=A0A6A5GP92_CAERE|nr:hypothetical protein GCK72_013703 [Caenorhabditis remanei]KAF1757248.1 hypothetical protein GCK72_013703 [Caenorhabditis remanei]